MPKISNILICDMPVRFDTYKGCSHGCEYCFVKLKRDMQNVLPDESAQTLLNFINKRRKGEIIEKIFDYDIPLHWGGVSDPFQPIEKEKKYSLQCLKVFKETQYPFVVSTKSDLISTDEYLDLIKQCNCAVQFSAVGSSYDNFESGAPTFQERMAAVAKISPFKRVLIRVQPMLPKMEKELLNNLKIFKDVGVYGVIVEFMKYKYKAPGTNKLAGDNVLPLQIIKPIFDKIKYAANLLGIKVFSGENRLRQYGDGLNCCGVGDLWKTHTANLNHLLFEGEICKNKYHKIIGLVTAGFLSLCQDSKRMQYLRSVSYQQYLIDAVSSKSVLQNYTIDKTAFGNIKKILQPQ